jgi:hypothetical protein
MNIMGFNSRRFMRYLDELPDRTVNLPLQDWCNATREVGWPPVGRRRVTRPMITPPPSPEPSPHLFMQPSPPRAHHQSKPYIDVIPNLKMSWPHHAIIVCNSQWKWIMEKCKEFSWLPLSLLDTTKEQIEILNYK